MMVFSNSETRLLFVVVSSLPSPSFVSLTLCLASNCSISLNKETNVGTVCGSKCSAVVGSKGTQTRPVLGWTHQGDFNKWLRWCDTAASNRGYVNTNTIAAGHCNNFLASSPTLPLFAWPLLTKLFASDATVNFNCDQRCSGVIDALDHSVSKRCCTDSLGTCLKICFHPSGLLSHNNPWPSIASSSSSSVSLATCFIKMGSNSGRAASVNGWRGYVTGA